MSLPACDHRVSYPERPGLHQCRHAGHFSAGNWVTNRACEVCPVRLVPCATPRPLPVEPPAPSGPATRVPTTGPGLVRRAVNFAAALAAHVAAGSPRADQETIDARLAICQTCPLFDGRRCQHVACGCAVSAADQFLNKLAWGDQGCPDGRWGPCP